MSRFTRPNLANMRSFVRIRRRHMDKMGPKTYNAAVVYISLQKLPSLGCHKSMSLQWALVKLRRFTKFSEINTTARLIFWSEQKQISEKRNMRGPFIASRTFNCYRLINHSISRSIKELICFL